MINTDNKPNNRRNFLTGTIAVASLAALTVGTFKGCRMIEGELSPRESMPDDFDIQERWLTYGCDFHLRDELGPFGTIDQTNFSITNEFTYKDGSGLTIAKARQKVLSWGIEIEIFDGKGTKLGSVEERIFDNFLKAYTKYDIKDANGNTVAKSAKLSLFSTDISISNMDNENIVTFHRDAVDPGKDTWDVKFQDTNFDRRLVIFIPAFKTNADNDRDSDSGNESKNSSK